MRAPSGDPSQGRRSAVAELQAGQRLRLPRRHRRPSTEDTRTPSRGPPEAKRRLELRCRLTQYMTLPGEAGWPGSILEADLPLDVIVLERVFR